MSEQVSHSFFDAMKDRGIICGTVVISGCGHDFGKVYVVVSERESFLYLCDGDKRTLGNPKKKRRKHVTPIGQIPGAVEWFESLKNLPVPLQGSEIRKRIRSTMDCHED